ncbi:MAG TPA: sulfatase/phosphatase domain-containing protein [Bryobacteraceae bacterium]
MIGRRSFLLAPLALACAQDSRPRVAVVWISAKSVPEDFAHQSIVFPRAYVACPQTRRALETGRFPHALRSSDRQVTDLLRPAAPDDPGTITVMTAESGDGNDGPLDRSIRVPLAIRWPGKLAPRIATEILISHVDVLPTLLAWAGVAIPDLQGRDLSALIVSGRGEVPDSIYSEGRIGQSGEWRVVVRGFEKLVLNRQDEATALYNLADDPDEGVNLVHERDHDLKRDGLLALARVWRQRVGDRIDPSGLRKRD